MNDALVITKEERHYLRELAKKQAGYAALPVMQERARRWYAHNSLRGDQPMLVMEMDTFEQDMLPPPHCTSPAARALEHRLLRPILSHECIDDDKVVPNYFTVDWKIDIDPYGVPVPVEHADDGRGGSIGYRWHHPIKTLKGDFSLLKPARFSVDREATRTWQTLAEDILGDILPVRVENNSLRWFVALSANVVTLMSLERMMLSLVDEPEEMHALFAYLRDNDLAFIRWQEEEGLLTLNNGNHYTGAGSYGFTDELPTAASAQNGRVNTRDLWLNMNSQETVGISPRMYRSFIFPYYRDIAEYFGLVYYGCCEPVHEIWECCIGRLPNLRKVSVSPWCDEDFMGEALRGSQVIYSRKPSPNFIGVGTNFDEDGFRAHIRKTLLSARGCELEIIFRDVYTLSGDQNKPRRAIQIAREEIEAVW